MFNSPQRKASFWPSPLSLLLFGTVVTMMFVVLRKDLKAATHPTDEIREHYRTIKWWLLPHAIVLGPALLLGPLQFVDAFRQHHPVLHRRVGWIYICGVILGVPIGIWVEIFKYRSHMEGSTLRMVIGTTGFGIIFLVTTATALFYAIRRRFQIHRRWMVRSYAVATIFLQTRTVGEIPMLEKLLKWPSDLLESHGISDGWMYIGFSLLVAELVLRYQSHQRRERTAVSPPVSLVTGP